jgi:phosphatidylserine decarboxylase
MLDNINKFIQYLLPKQLLTQLFGYLANKPMGILTTWMIKGFIKIYDVNMNEAQISEPQKYPTFNAFFARHLADNVRPIDQDENSVVMPVDGVISQFGKINDGVLIQAKGHNYSLDTLLACQQTMVEPFKNGKFATMYLSPKNYHRVHMPCDATLREMIYVPGSLFSVNSTTANGIPNLFARNERVICHFDTEFGPMIQILVGATIVGSIETKWQGVVTPPRDGMIKRWTYDNVTLAKGEEMGCFKLGSTVITLFTDNQIDFASTMTQGMTARVGQVMGQRI